MPKSAAFIRIKSQVLEITQTIPAGQVTSFRAIGNYLDVVPRQVAYILAMLSAEEQALVPWYRVVNDDGTLSRPKYDASGATQAQMLIADGVNVQANLAIANFSEIFFPINPQTVKVVPVPRQPATAKS